MNEYAYLLWTMPDYCRDNCCTRLRGVFLDEAAALIERERLDEGEHEAEHYVTRATLGRVSEPGDGS